MRAMVLGEAEQLLELADRSEPEPGPGEVRIRVSACGVCRTDLHIIDGELTDPSLPLIPGHQIVGEVVELGDGVDSVAPGDRVGVPWLGWTCGECWYCRHDMENLCEDARFTGYHRDGGFAEQTVADARYAFPLPGDEPDLQIAPLLCAGLIGYRSYRTAVETAGEVGRIGLYGFGSAAHILAQVAIHHGRDVYAFTRPGDEEGQAFARELGCVWAGPSDEPPPATLDAAIIFAPVGPLVPAALKTVRKAGAVVCAGIHMSEIPAFSYDILWEERVVRSVANLERRDAEEFLALALEVPVRTEVHTYALDEVNEALDDLRAGRFEGSAVIDVGGA
ncbi:MAG: zinc-dependent alcohol dehydrogenase family protein [Candidatus Longimicrobiales bacterium M2_2A_002]